MKRLLPAVLLCCCAFTPSTAPSPPRADPFCAALKSNLGRAILQQKRVSDDIVHLVSKLSDYSKYQMWGETGSAYTSGFDALKDQSTLDGDLTQLHKLMQQIAPVPSGNPDAATIVKNLQTVADSQTNVAKETGSLLSEWNQHVQLDANSPGNTGMGSHGANPFSGLGGSGGGSSSGIAVMEVRPLLVNTLKTMDVASAALGEMHAAIMRTLTSCSSRVRRQSTGG